MSSSATKPKGVHAAFVQFLCPSTDPLDISQTAQLFSSVSGYIVVASCILVPLWLVLLRWTLSGSTALTVLLFFFGLAFFLAADSMADRERQRHKHRTSVTADTARFPASRPAYTALITPHRGADTAAANPTAAAAVVAAPTQQRRGMPKAVVALAGKPDPVLTKQVQKKIIRIEAALFGNELTESVLPPGVLPQRVLTLCEELGVTPKGAAADKMTLAQMSLLLDEMAAHVGV